MAQDLINSTLKCLVDVGRYIKVWILCFHFTIYCLPITGLSFLNSRCTSFIFKNIYTQLKCLYICVLGTSIFQLSLIFSIFYLCTFHI